jgi:hypothetical protein
VLSPRPRAPGATLLALLLLGVSPIAGRVSAAPSTPAASAAPGSSSAEFVAELVARAFLRAILDGQTATALPLCAEQVNFDGRLVRGRQALEEALQRLQQRARRLSLRLQKIVVLPATFARRRYGPPPARLADAVAPGRMVALARLSSAGVVVVLRQQGGLWRVIALTD